jgi:hypothetical protein
MGGVLRYRPGKQSEKPDALSRRDDVYPRGGDGAYAANNPHNIRPLLKQSELRGLSTALRSGALGVPNVSGIPEHSPAQLRSDLKLAQDSDPKVAKLRDSLPPSYSTDADDLLLFDERLYVPDNDAVKLAILRSLHDHPISGHPVGPEPCNSSDATSTGLKPRTLSSATSLLASPAAGTRPIGIDRKASCNLFRFLLNHGWKSLSMNFIDQLPNSGGFDSILVVVDRFSKMAHFIPTSTTSTTLDLAKAFISNVWSKHGLPDDIVSDRGSRFVSKFWDTLTSALLIKRNLSTAYHPESDGQTERVHQSLEAYLRFYINYQQDDWADWLPLAEFAYNNSDHSSTGKSPFFVNSGYNPRFNFRQGVTISPAGSDLVQSLQDVHAKVRESIQSAIARYKRNADKSRTPAPEYKVGDLVMLSRENIHLTRPSRSLSERQLGPYPVVQIVSPSAVKLRLPSELSRLHPVFHVSLLSPWSTPDIPGRQQAPPGPVAIEGQDEYEIKAIVDSTLRGRSKHLHYRVEWLGYADTPEQYTWEPAENWSTPQTPSTTSMPGIRPSPIPWHVSKSLGVGTTPAPPADLGKLRQPRTPALASESVRTSQP